MKLTSLRVQNYRALRDVELTLSRFGCFIGKNNAGKSTVLQAVALFFSGSKLSSKDFYNPANPIRIEICIEEIGQEDLSRLAPEHREKLEPIIVGGKLNLVRRYDTSGNSKFMYVTLVPKDERFEAGRITALLKGKTKGALVQAALSVFPELQGKLEVANVTQAKVKEEIQALADRLPVSEKHLSDSDLPTGIDASIKPLLPDTIYIPAVKNLADDVKAKESTPFGKMLGILLAAIEPQLGDVKRFLSELHEKFNRILADDGVRVDNRLAEVQLIEQTVQNYLRESFANVSLEINIPPPELKTILSSAELLIDDGIQGNIETKGDGLRRAAVFAILRSYVALSQPGAMAAKPSGQSMDRYLLLFEEPELYLHPCAQRVLFDALGIFARDNHVLLTTHSPYFFGPESTASFTKLIKVSSDGDGFPPFTESRPIDLSTVNSKDQFQLICFENNNAAFFYDSVILVEGDSDYIVIPHVARLLTARWETVSSAHKFVRVNGKGSLKRYREFFSQFGVRVAVVSDLDLLLRGVESLVNDEGVRDCRNRLLNVVDAIAERDYGFKEPSPGKVKDAQAKTELFGLWKRVKRIWNEVKQRQEEFETLEDAVEEFLAWERSSVRLKVLEESRDDTLRAAKLEMLAMLRKFEVFVLEKGALEAYYPTHVNGHDKPSKAQDFCRKVTTRELVLSLCGDHVDSDGLTLRKEFEIICDGLFGNNKAEAV